MPAPALDEATVLPPGFEDLLEFVPHWIGEKAQERWDIRARATMAEITRFYDVLLPRSEAILDHVERSEEHTSELQSLMLISYAVFCLKNKKKKNYYCLVNN